MASPSTIVRVRPDLGLEARDPVAVDEDVVVATEPGDRPAHREVGRVVDVELVDLADRRRADTDGDGPRADERREALALGRERVLESRTPGIRWQPGRMITAAATTAPQVGATPTSSTPDDPLEAVVPERRSWRRVGTILAIGRQGSPSGSSPPDGARESRRPRRGPGSTDRVAGVLSERFGARGGVAALPTRLRRK